jgi:hypothetical protein
MEWLGLPFGGSGICNFKTHFHIHKKKSFILPFLVVFWIGEVSFVLCQNWHKLFYVPRFFTRSIEAKKPSGVDKFMINVCLFNDACETTVVMQYQMTRWFRTVLKICETKHQRPIWTAMMRKNQENWWWHSVSEPEIQKRVYWILCFLSIRFNTGKNAMPVPVAARSKA